MRRMKKGKTINCALILMALMCLNACSIPIDDQVVIEENKRTESQSTLLIPSTSDYSGKFVGSSVTDYYLLMKHNSPYYVIRELEPPWFDSKDWRAEEKKWAGQMIVENSPEFVSLAWNDRYVEKDLLMAFESYDGPLGKTLANPYIVPLGTYIDSFRVRKSELMRVLSDEEFEKTKDLPLIEIMDLYYSKSNADRHMVIYNLLNVAAEPSPFDLPTPLRIHHKRINKDNVLEVVRNAIDLKEKWNLLVSDNYNGGLLDEYTASNSLNAHVTGDCDERELYLYRPMWEDPVPFGVASSKGSQDLYAFHDFTKAMKLEETQMALYMLSHNNRYGGYFSPVDPKLHDELKAFELGKGDYGIRQSREYYKTWIEKGPWEPELMCSDETGNKYVEIITIIYEVLKEERPLDSKFEQEIDVILKR